MGVDLIFLHGNVPDCWVSCHKYINIVRDRDIMLLNFRQGLVQIEPSGFITVGPTTATLTVYDIPIIVAIASGTTDYLHVEHVVVPDAWSIFPGIDQWLYWDIHPYSAERTFGVTTVPPISSAQEPANPATDQHWFDTISATTKVWSGTHWSEKNRVFACKLATGSVVSSMSVSAPDFTGTQAGIVATTTAGEILYDILNGKPLRSGNKFVTTENILTTHTVTKSDVKFAATLIPAEAQQAMARLTVVNFNDFGKIVHADASVANDEIPFGIIQHDCIPGDVVTVTMNGAITSPFWDWSAVGINSPLYCTDSGSLTPTPQIPQQIPVAYIIDTNSILINPVSITLGDTQVIPKVLDDLDDVVISVPTNNQVLVYNGNMWVNGPSVTDLNGLTDVVIAAPTNNQVLVYNGSMWVNGPAVTDLNSLTDVTITSPIQGDLLQYNGVEWVNADLTGYRQLFTVNDGQTVFGPLLQTYVPNSGQLSVYINGLKQMPTTYVETNSTTFTLTSPAHSTDVIMAEISEITPTYITPITILDQLADVTISNPLQYEILQYNGTQWINSDLTGYRQTFTATSGQTVFGPLSNPYVVGAGQLSVYIDGVKQYPGTYTETSTTSFTLTSPAVVGETILAEISVLQGPFVATPPAQDDIVAVFRVGEGAQEATHVHFVAMTKTQAESLITGTSATVTITSTEQNGHTHAVTFSYNDAQYTWVVDSITNNVTDNHLCIEVNHTFEGLTGVTVTNPTPGQVLTYQEYPFSTTEVYPGQGYWYNADPSGGGGQSDYIIHAVSSTTLQIEDTYLRAWKPGSPATPLMTVGGRGVAMGVGAGYSTPGNYDNVAIGTAALKYPDQSGDNVAIGKNAIGGSSTPSSYRTVAIGMDAMSNVGHSDTDVSIGLSAMYGMTRPDGLPASYTNDNIAIGRDSMAAAGTMSSNVAIGPDAMGNVPYGNASVAIGSRSQYGGYGTPAVRPNALVVGCWYRIRGADTFDWTTVGAPSNSYDTPFQATGTSNAAYGTDYVLLVNRSPNISIGADALYMNYSGQFNIAIGTNSMYSNLHGINNTAVGEGALGGMRAGHRNTAIGTGALHDAGVEIHATQLVASITYRITRLGDVDFTTVGAATNAIGEIFTATGPYTGPDLDPGYATPVITSNTAVGDYALSSLSHYSNATGVGANAEVTGSNQVQLGDSSTTTYAYGAVQNRSDARDKADIRDTVIGLNFIQQLRPVDFKWDYREDYITSVTAEDGSVTWTRIPPDGTKKRTRYHHGLIAQEVKQVLETTGLDFGGYQDHTVAGGNDVLTLRYEELIAPLIKAVQELATQNQALADRVTALESSIGG